MPNGDQPDSTVGSISDLQRQVEQLKTHLRDVRQNFEVLDRAYGALDDRIHRIERLIVSARDNRRNCGRCGRLVKSADKRCGFCGSDNA